MVQAWRIVKEKHAMKAFSGEGAAKSGGRWNSRGVAVVYASGSQSLAALETLVHLNPPVMFRYSIFRIQIADELVGSLPPSSLPADWRCEPPPRSIQAIGDAWVRKAEYPALAVPSAIIPGECNYLLNPAHPDFKRIIIGAPERFTFDARLLG